MSLPPLNAIRVFEAIGRTGSVKAAAEELFVTPGAASRQLAKLEESLEVALFKRSHRQITLTPAGMRYFETVSDLLVQLSDVTEEIRTSKGRRPLHIWCPMTFGQRWLVPRLQAFREQHPDRVVIFTTSLGPIDRNSTTTDVAIRIGRGSWPGCVSHRLMPIQLTPVCSPALVEQLGPFLTARDLLRTTLLQSSARPGYWRIWLDAAQAKDLDPDRGITFESVSLAYQMAISGAGVAMGQAVLVEDDLRAKRLVAPFPLIADSMDAFYLIYPNRLAQDPFVCQFRDWVLGEATEQGLHTPA